MSISHENFFFTYFLEKRYQSLNIQNSKIKLKKKYCNNKLLGLIFII